MRSKFKYAIIFAIISFSISIASGIYGGFKLMDKYVFEYIYNVVMEGYFEIKPEDQLYMQYYNTLQSALVISSFLSALLCVPALIFCIICINHYSLSIEAFDRKRKIHILTLVFIGIGFFASNNAMGSMVNTIFATLSTPCEILSIASFFMFLHEYRFNARQMVLKGKYNNDYPTYTKKENKEEIIDAEITPIKEEVIDEQEKIKRNQRLDELYSLLAKLEKSYKNNEISTEEYQRMKETILSNFKSNN